MPVPSKREGISPVISFCFTQFTTLLGNLGIKVIMKICNEHMLIFGPYAAWEQFPFLRLGEDD